MPNPERSVLHVLPHAGGGGDTYVDVLSDMSGYTFQRVYVAPKRKPRVGEVVAGVLDLRRVLRGYDLLHVHGEGAAGMFLPLLAWKRSVTTFHGLHLLRRATGVRRRAAELNLRAVVRAADRTICVSAAERDVLTAATGPAGARRTVVVHNGARARPETGPPNRTQVREQLGLTETEPVGIWVGSLDERRDPLAVVRAAEQTSTTLLVVGDGPLRTAVERAAGAHAHILGQRQDVPHLLRASDFFVLMSQREGLSFALLEAMACGLPAIVADIPENIEAVGDSGLPVPYGDEEATAAAFLRLVHNERERTTLGERAQQRVSELFDVDEMVARTRAVYDEVFASE
jgi:glycosyltransferase involved in cell wall biosynthesis